MSALGVATPLLDWLTEIVVSWLTSLAGMVKVMPLALTVPPLARVTLKPPTLPALGVAEVSDEGEEVPPLLTAARV